MNTLAAQCIKITSQSRNKRLTFTGLHLCNSTLVKCNTADKLNIKVTLTNSSYRCLTHRCKSLWKKIIQTFSFDITSLKLISLRLELFITHCLHCWLKRIDLLNNTLICLKVLVSTKRQNLREEIRHSFSLTSGIYL